MIAQREADAAHKRQQRAEREAAQKAQGGRPWRYFR
jgi:hypothetical protein